MWEGVALFFVKFDSETRLQRYEIKETMAQFVDELEVTEDIL
jgi:hypothetical protein